MVDNLVDGRCDLIIISLIHLVIIIENIIICFQYSPLILSSVPHHLRYLNPLDIFSGIVGKATHRRWGILTPRRSPIRLILCPSCRFCLRSLFIIRCLRLGSRSLGYSPCCYPLRRYLIRPFLLLIVIIRGLPIRGRTELQVACRYTFLPSRYSSSSTHSTHR